MKRNPVYFFHSCHGESTSKFSLVLSEMGQVLLLLNEMGQVSRVQSEMGQVEQGMVFPQPLPCACRPSVTE